MNEPTLTCSPASLASHSQPELMIKCAKCKQLFPASMFYRDASTIHGRRYYCKPCDVAACRRYRNGNKRKLRKARRIWYAKNKASISHHNRKYRIRHRAETLMRSARDRARIKRLAFDLDRHVLELKERLALGKCELTGITLDIAGRKQWNSPSIDRINPSRGYTYDNVRIVCYGVNCALGTWREDKLKIIAERLLAHDKNHN